MTVDLATALTEVEQALAMAEAEIGPRADSDRSWWDRRKVIMDRCAASLTESLGASVNDQWDGCRVRIAGVAASSTMGFPQALRNWTAAVRRRLDAAGAVT